MYVLFMGFWFIISPADLRRADAERVGAAVGFCTVNAVEDDAEPEDIAACITAQAGVNVKVRKDPRHARRIAR